VLVIHSASVPIPLNLLRFRDFTQLGILNHNVRSGDDKQMRLKGTQSCVRLMMDVSNPADTLISLTSLASSFISLE